jgi:DNA-directed RNA polymerase sigma subunit (sigma70/sigma32)
VKSNLQVTEQVRTAKRIAPRVPWRAPKLRRARRLPAAEPTPRQVPEPEPSTTPSLRGDAYQLYLREIGQVKLLTPAEEIELALRIQRGDDAAREEMIKANLRLVVKIARDYEGLGLPLLDLINEGNIGLMKGVERFHPDKGAKLSTYASWWIKQSIKRALGKPIQDHPAARPCCRQGGAYSASGSPIAGNPRPGSNRRGGGRGDQG